MSKTKNAAPTGRELIRTELFMMLTQLRGARECANLYQCPDLTIKQKLSEVQEKINSAMNDLACVIGWDVLEQVEAQKL